jgi:hypothetical protein
MTDCLLIVLLILLILHISSSHICISKRKEKQEEEEEEEDDKKECVESMVSAPAKRAQSYNHYSDYLLSAGVEKSVVDSHKQFVDEIHHKTTGASTETVRDDSNDVNPRWGLRKTNYFDAVSGVDARTTSSEDPRQMYQWRPTGLI